MIRWGGIRFRLHPLFVLMLAVSAMIGHFVELIVLFGVVLIHELGHVAAARWFGWRVLEVRLLPFGGVAVVDAADGANSRQEAAVALAGPLQNLVMIGLAFFFRRAGFWPDDWADYFIQVNLAIGLFNLLPAEPLDGGKVLSAWVSRHAAMWPTLLAGSVIGLIISAGMAVYALMQWPDAGLKANLLLITGFLAFHNAYEWKNRHFRFLRFLLRRQRDGGLLSERQQAANVIAALEPLPANAIFKRFMRERYHLIAVLDDRGKVRRVYSEKELLDDFFHANGAPAPNMLE